MVLYNHKQNIQHKNETKSVSENRREYRKGKQEYYITLGTDKGDWDCKSA